VSGVVDFRVQPPYKSFRRLHFYRPRPAVEDPVSGNPFAFARPEDPSFDSLDRFHEEMDEHGIGHAVVVGQRADPQWGRVENEDIAELVADHPGRYSGVAGIDPTDPDAEEQVVRALDELGLAGIHLVPGWSDPALRDDDPALLRLYERCAERGALVMVTSSHFIGPDLEHSRPVFLQRAAMQFPELTFVVGHASWPWTLQAVAVAMRCTNVYLMPEFYLYLSGMPGASHYLDALNTFLRHRVLYSSCAPSRSVGHALSLARALDIDEASVEPFFGGSARRLLGLP
jgi:predicted TIM-barrel fold metal-dependent hydrolase